MPNELQNAISLREELRDEIRGLNSFIEMYTLLENRKEPNYKEKRIGAKAAVKKLGNFIEELLGNTNGPLTIHEILRAVRKENLVLRWTDQPQNDIAAKLTRDSRFKYDPNIKGWRLKDQCERERERERELINKRILDEFTNTKFKLPNF